jgi:hypothetical protein
MLPLNKPENSECGVSSHCFNIPSNDETITTTGTGMKRVLEECNKFMVRNETVKTLVYVIDMYTCTYIAGRTL